jgi:hypothetical protein
MPTLIHLWECARTWLWIHPWYHATILFSTPVLISIILGIWGLRHSHEANRLSGQNNRLHGEANVLRGEAIRIGEEQKTSVAKIAEVQGERNKLQVELNELQAKRNPVTRSDRSRCEERPYTSREDGSQASQPHR